MSTQNESRNLVQRAVIATDPQNAILEYIISKQEERNLNIRKYPEWDKARACPSTEIIMAHRELIQVEDVLKEKWIEQRTRRKDMDEQWEELRSQELSLRESFVKFNKLVMENIEKRERAEQKIKEEQERQAKRQQEVNELEQRLTFMKGTCDKIQQYVKEYKKYQNYLERVVNETNEFQSVNEIFNRYETLIEARLALSDHQDKNFQLLEERGTKIV